MKSANSYYVTDCLSLVYDILSIDSNYSSACASSLYKTTEKLAYK